MGSTATGDDHALDSTNSSRRTPSDSDGGGITVANGIGPPVRLTAEGGDALDNKHLPATGGDHHLLSSVRLTQLIELMLLP
jgi:hypothetical protein